MCNVENPNSVIKLSSPSAAFRRFRAQAASEQAASVVMLLIAILLTGFSFYKSATASFTHDESYSYLHYVPQSFLDIVSYKTPFTNNHILNSLGMKYAEQLLGSSALALRLPNLLALVVYLLFSFRLVSELKAGLRVPAFMILSLNPYLLDFFGLARGYGLSIGFMIMSLYYLTRYLRTWRDRDALGFNAGAFLAVLSNFALINFYLAGLVVFNAWLLARKFWLGTAGEGSGKGLLRHNRVNLIAFLITIGVVYEPFRKILKHQFVDFGGRNGFLADTVESSLVRFFYLAPVKPNAWGVAPIDATWLIVLKAFVVAVPMLALALILFQLLKKNRAFFDRSRPLVVANGVLLLIVLGTILQFHLFGTQYLMERFALFLVPLFLLNLIFLLSELAAWTKGRWIGAGLLYVFALLFLLHTTRRLNARFYLDWKYDMATRPVIEALVEEKAGGAYDSIHLGSNWLFSPALNFYRVTWRLDWLTEIYQHGGLGEYDHFFYEFNEDLGKVELDLSEKEVLLRAEEIGTRLLRVRAGK